jgi:hypothetical protein
MWLCRLNDLQHMLWSLASNGQPASELAQNTPSDNLNKTLLPALAYIEEDLSQSDKGNLIGEVRINGMLAATQLPL